MITPTEKTAKILRLLADGLTIETVALMVGVSERFVKHIENVNNQNKNTMKTQEIKTKTRIRLKGFDISIGVRPDQVAIISHGTDYFTPFEVVKKGGRLARIKSRFKLNLSSSTHFFFEGLTEDDILEIIRILK